MVIPREKIVEMFIPIALVLKSHLENISADCPVHTLDYTIRASVLLVFLISTS